VVLGNFKTIEKYIPVKLSFTYFLGEVYRVAKIGFISFLNKRKIKWLAWVPSGL
jgi:hypothetical protein